MGSEVAGPSSQLGETMRPPEVVYDDAFFFENFGATPEEVHTVIKAGIWHGTYGQMLTDPKCPVGGMVRGAYQEGGREAVQLKLDSCSELFPDFSMKLAELPPDYIAPVRQEPVAEPVKVVKAIETTAREVRKPSDPPKSPTASAQASVPEPARRTTAENSIIIAELAHRSASVVTESVPPVAQPRSIEAEPSAIRPTPETVVARQPAAVIVAERPVRRPVTEIKHVTTETRRRERVVTATLPTKPTPEPAEARPVKSTAPSRPVRLAVLPERTASAASLPDVQPSVSGEPAIVQPELAEPVFEPTNLDSEAVLLMTWLETVAAELQPAEVTLTPEASVISETFAEYLAPLDEVETQVVVDTIETIEEAVRLSALLTELGEDDQERLEQLVEELCGQLFDTLGIEYDVAELEAAVLALLTGNAYEGNTAQTLTGEALFDEGTHEHKIGQLVNLLSQLSEPNATPLTWLGRLALRFRQTVSTAAPLPAES